MPDIYEQHRAAFARVSAFVVVRDGERVATVAIKFPANGASRLYAYVHVIGSEMVRGWANGYGYDKRSAAVYSACKALKFGADDIGHDVPAVIELFRDAAPFMDRMDWTEALRSAGLKVWQAV